MGGGERGEGETGRSERQGTQETGFPLTTDLPSALSSPSRQYVETAATIAQFGYRQMDGLTFDHPSDNLHGFARIGRKEIVTYTTEGEGEWGGSQGQGVRCRSYQLTRIRCWKVGYWVSADPANSH